MTITMLKTIILNSGCKNREREREKEKIQRNREVETFFLATWGIGCRGLTMVGGGRGD